MEESEAHMTQVFSAATAFVADVQEKAGSCGIREASASTQRGDQDSDWFLQVLREPASSTNEMPLLHCKMCNRIVLQDRFHLHACQTTCCPKTSTCTPVSIARSRNCTQSRRAKQGEKETRRDGRNIFRGSMAASAGGTMHRKANGKQGRKWGKRGQGELEADVSAGDQGNVHDIKGAFWLMGGPGCWPGKKVKMRKLSDVVRNGPTLVLGSPAHYAGADDEWDLPAMGRNDVSTDFCGQDLDWWGGGVEWPRDDGPRMVGSIESSWLKDWEHLSTNGLLKFPDRVRRRRSPFPIR